MRYLMLVSTTKNPGPVPPAMIQAMDRLMGEGMKNGTLRDGGEFGAPQNRKMVRLQGGKVTDTDGPYAEAKEAVGGFAILDYPTHEAALQSTHDFLALHAKHWPGWEGTVTMFPINAGHGPEPKR